MSDNTGNSAASLRRKIDSAGELQGVVRTMKAVAASNIGQYEKAVHSLDTYYSTVQLALSACLRHNNTSRATAMQYDRDEVQQGIGAVVFGSDLGLVGPFNDAMVDFVIKTLSGLPGKKTVLAVGERIQSRLIETDLSLGARFFLPASIDAITSLVGQILVEVETLREKQGISRIYLFHHRPAPGAGHESVSQQLLPLDDKWRHEMAAIKWPTHQIPQVINSPTEALRAFVREYLFVSIFRACAHSLASENASRLAAMQRAEKNIDELLEDLNRTFHRLRQSSIDEELFDVLSGFEALSSSESPF